MHPRACILGGVITHQAQGVEAAVTGCRPEVQQRDREVGSVSGFDSCSLL